MSEFEQWLETRPPLIKELGKKYPPGKYKIAEDAPYGITCPGTIVSIMAYNESGMIRVMVEPEHILPGAIEHMKAILRSQGRDFAELSEEAISAHVDPQWLVPYKE